ncbi:hypothetical protein [Marinobacter sp. LV10R510-11A]|uniref:hypothetical protein n=1 Tax=Marinobacter sp. LV10R510-11A TaxID=1415568 RepID=UPI000BB7081F|nr:hypothetical protein [Marinobacter sp. LV10R510-11A]
MLQLAMFQTLFNGIGVLLFWPWHKQLERGLRCVLPDRAEPAVMITDAATGSRNSVEQRELPESHARYLNEAALMNYH